MDTMLPETPEEFEFDSTLPEPGEEDVELEENKEFSYDEEKSNLVEDFEGHPEGEDFLKKTLKEIDTMFQESWDKNHGYRENCAESWALLYGKHAPKQPPYQGCPNPHVPLMLQNMTRLCNRIENELFGDFERIVQFVPMSAESEPIADICTQHTNWQFSNRIPSFKRNVVRALWIFAVGGDVVGHSYYDTVLKTNCHDVLTCDDFVTPYTHVSTTDDYSDIPWLAKRTSYYRAKLQSMAKEWSNIDKVLKYEPADTRYSEVSKELRDEVADYHEEEMSTEGRSEYEVIHWEGWLQLPNQTADRYCQFIYELNSRAVLKLSIHERANYMERYRYKYQQQEAEQYQMALQQYQQMLLQKEQTVSGLYDSVGNLDQQDPQLPDIIMQARQVEQTPMPPEPQKPSWMIGGAFEPEPPQKSPIYMFSHGVCLEPMLGNLGIGIGTIDADFNKAANIALALFIDAAVMANGRTLISAGNVDFKSPFKIAPGHINKAKNVMPSDLKNAFIDLDFGGANPQLMQLVQTLLSFGESATQTPDILSGAPGKSGETARGFQGRLEQITTMLTIPAKHFGRFVTQLAKNNNKLNAIFLKDYETFYVNADSDVMGQAPGQTIAIQRDYYDNEFKIKLDSDMQFRTRAQKVAERDEIVQLPTAVPALAQNLPFIYHAIKESLQARGMHKFAGILLGPPPPPPQTPLGIPMPPPPPPQGAPPPPPGAA